MRQFSFRSFLFVTPVIFAVLVNSCSTSTAPQSGGTASGGGLVVPSTVNFGAVSLGQTKDTLLSIFNENADTVTITGDATSTAALVDSNFTHSLSIAGNTYKNIEVAFTPTAQALMATDSIQYENNGKHYVAAMTFESNGSGTTGGGPSAMLVVPATVDFGSLPIGQWKDTSIILVNTGALTITSSSLSGTEARDTNFNLPVVLASAGYITVHIQFNPSAVGPRSVNDTIHYTSGGTKNTAVIALVATGSQTVTTPGPGSTYTYSVDTNGTALPPSTYTVVSNTLSFQGKTNVVEIRDDTGGLQYYHVESNGDLSVFVDFNTLAPLPLGLPTAWLTIPLGSHQTTTNLLYDTSITYNSLPVTIQLVDTGRYVGPSQVPAAKKVFQTDQGSISVALTASTFGFAVASAETVVNIWYAKQIAFYPKRRDIAVTNAAALGIAPSNVTTNYLLTSYTVH